MKLKFTYKVYIGAVFVFVLTATIGIVSYLTLRKQAKLSEQVKHTYKVINLVQNVQNQVVDMETGRRGFRATKENRFLQPYYSGLQNIHPALGELKNAIAGNEEQENRAETLGKHIYTLILFWKNISNNPETVTKESVVSITDDEKKQMDGIRALVNELLLAENSLLLKREKENATSIGYAILSASAGTITVQIIIFILIFLVVGEFAKRKKANEQLRQSNLKLINQAAVLHTSEDNLKNAVSSIEIINKQLEKFVYIVAHDIKSPLSGISGALFIIAKDKTIATNDQLAKFVRLSADAVSHLSEMVDSILEYSRTSFDQQTIEEVSTKELIEQMAVLMFPPQNIHIRVSDEMPVFKTKKLKIEQVFQNLISNAIKYNDKEQGLIEIGCNNKPGHYEFYVKDNGMGISGADETKVFTVFKPVNKTTRLDSSTGFGLSIVKLMVEEQGGNIWFESVRGKGSTFYFEWKK